MKDLPKLKILMPTPTFFPEMGGIEMHVYQVSRRMVRQGMSVTILTTDRKGLFPKEEIIEGVRVIRVRALPSDRDWHFAPDLIHVIESGKRQWDLMHLQSYHTFVAPFVLWGALRAELPYVITPHSGGHASKFRNSVRGIHRGVLYPFISRSKKIITISRFEYELYKKLVPLKRLALIPNGFEPIEDDGSLTDMSIDGNLILSVGRLEPNKGHQRIISAMPYIISKRPQVKLRVIGKGSYEDTLRNLVKKLNLSHCVEIGGIPPDDRNGMARALRSASVVTLLSDYENHPVAVLEALTMKRPVLLADNSGLREIARRGWARSIPTNSKPEEIAKAVLGQLDDPLIPENVDIFSWDDCTQNILAVYREVL